jgi:ABC-type uncharacterized transport system substrate-binding protein
MREKDSYSARILPTILVQTLMEAQQEIERRISQCDAFILTNLLGLTDENEAPMSEAAVFTQLTRRFDKAILGAIPDHVKYGALLTVASSGLEQGNLAAEMMVACLEGTPAKDLPMRRNRQGRRIVNLQTMRRLGIRPMPAALVGATIFDGE